MILSLDKNNISRAYNNQNLYYKLSTENKSKWINNLYNYYNKTLPLINYNKSDVQFSFNLLCKNQNYSISTTCNDLSLFEKYNFINLIKFIKSTKQSTATSINNTNTFLNCNIIIFDDDYKQNYVQ